MRLTILSRLVISYAVLFISLMTLSIYVTHQLLKMQDATQSILEVGNRVIDYEKKLTDTLLTQLEYEMKFIIVKDRELYRRFLSAQQDFDKNLKDLMLTLADSLEARSLTEEIRYFQRLFQFLFKEEAAYILDGLPYSEEWYEQEKEAAINKTMVGLKKIRSLIQEGTSNKITGMAETTYHTYKVAMIITWVALILGISVSILITRSITKPLALVKRETQSIAKGNFRGDLHVVSPPEIAELAEAFNYMSARLNEIDKMKSDFYSTISHELRTPLTSIKEGVNLLAEGVAGGLQEKQKRLLAILTEESNRLIHMVNNLLDLSKMEAGMIAFDFSRSDLSSLIEKVIMELEPLAQTKNISITKNISGGPLSIRMDSERILQVLRNLVGNAVKFTPPDGSVIISANVLNHEVRVSVEDTGVGISKEHLERIFDKYQQSDAAVSTTLRGTGLGLSIVKHIIHAHGGNVWAESEPGRGSTLIFVLPA